MDQKTKKTSQKDTVNKTASNIKAVAKTETVKLVVNKGEDVVKIVPKNSSPDKAALKKATTSKTPEKSVSKAKPAKKSPKKIKASKAKKAIKKAIVIPKQASKAIPKGAAFGANTLINDTMEKMMTKGPIQFDKLAQEASDFGRDNVEALIKSSTIFAKGFEDIVRTTMSLAQTSAEKRSQLVKEAMTTKSVDEWADMQNKMAQEGYEDFVANATKISELSSKLLTEASEPISSQVTKATNKATKATKKAA